MDVPPVTSYGALDEISWPCVACTLLNSFSSMVCEACGHKQPDPEVAVLKAESGEPSCQLCWSKTGIPWDVKQQPQEGKAKEGETPAVLLVCQHTCCGDCIQGWATTRLGEGITHIPCPICPVPAHKEGETPVLRAELPIEVIVKFAGKAVADKLERFRKDRAMESDANVFWCPHTACGRPTRLTGSSRRVVCEHCQKASCRKCKRAYHTFPRCSGNDPFLAAWEADAIANGREVKACPGCKRKTEREGGCLNITCTCGQRYCWVCLMAWPCPNGCGLKHGQDGTKNAQAAPVGLRNARLMYMRRMGMCTLAVLGGAVVGAFVIGGFSLLIGLFLLCCPCLFVAKCCFNKQMEDDHDTLNEWVNIVAAVTAAIVFSPVLVAVAFICAIPGMFYLIYVILFGACIDTGLRRGLYGPLTQLQGSQEWLDPKAPIYTEYKGPLPAKVVVVGKVSLVILWLCIMLPLGAIFAVVTVPIAPLFLLPICICPSLTVNKWVKAIVTLAFAGGALALYFLWTTATMHLRVIISVLLFVVGFGIAWRTPTSDWAFLGVLWQGALAPCASILGFVNPVNPENNPFTGPVPFPGPYVLMFEDWNGHIAL